MKKIILSLAVSALLFVGACAKSEEGKEQAHPIETRDAKTERQAVKVTIPMMFFEGEDIDEAIEEAKGKGVKKVTKNEDGSITYQMSKRKQQEMLTEMTKMMTAQLRELEEGEDFHSIEKISYNKRFDSFTVEVQRDAFENSLDGFGLLAIGFSGMYYQLFDGKAEEAINVQIDLVDVETGELFDSIHYPEALEQS